MPHHNWTILRNQAYAYSAGRIYRSNIVEVYNAVPPSPSTFKTWMDDKGNIHAAICGLCTSSGQETCCEIPLEKGCITPVYMGVDREGRLRVLIADSDPCASVCACDITIPVTPPGADLSS